MAAPTPVFFVTDDNTPMTLPLMPRATAIWLVDNTALTFEQIAVFCGVHILEVQAIADGDGTQNLRAVNPIMNGQLTADEIARCEKAPAARLQHRVSTANLPKSKSSARYTPIAKRRDKPNAIAWLVRQHPELTDLQICKLIGTTKGTIQSIRNKTYWNYTSLTPVDPVFAGLCSQTLMNDELTKAAPRRPAALPEESQAPLAPQNIGTDYDTPATNADDARAMAEKLFGG